MFGPPQLDEVTIRSIDFNRTSRRMLQDMREESWGWVVYRTTYSSDPAFHKAIEILTS
jgi:ribosome biogenesis GTPase A